MKDWNEAHRRGASALQEADRAWANGSDPVSLAAIGLELMDEGYSDDEVRQYLRSYVDSGGARIGDMPHVAKLRTRWEGEGRRARAHARTVDLPKRPNAPADGAAILDRVHKFIGRFVAYPSKAAHDAHVLWIAHTHAM